VSTLLFVYGTLLPGAESWEVLEPLVEGPGTRDSVRGELFDTGLGYPTAIVDDQSTSIVHGRTMQLSAARSTEALGVLDDFEDVAGGLFRRVLVTTTSGASAWVYTNGGVLALTPIPSGDWMGRRG
jgi:gamma-glutamylcyclotransferase (GGCT)/AIG2-like uncharacterized protein YtfP